MRKILLGLAFATALTTSAFAEDDVNRLEALNRLTQSANFVLGAGEGFCSGTLLSKKYRIIVTANHCVEELVGTKKKTVIGRDGEVKEIEVRDVQNIPVSQNNYEGHDVTGSKTWVARIIDHNAETDIALIQIIEKSIPQTVEVKVLPLSGKVLPGQAAWAVGNPAMMGNTVLKATVSNVTRKIEVGGQLTEYTQFQASITGGISGGALLNDDLNYIGTVVAGMRGTDISLASPVEGLRKILRKNCFGSLVDAKFAKKDEECRGLRKWDDSASPKPADDVETDSYTGKGWGPH